MPVKVSVVIGVYNTENYLNKCLESVAGQSLSDIEIIVVNDGSTDGSLEIINQYKSRDGRMIVFDVENGGVSKARNMGLERARGEYIIFIDSDDFLAPEMLELMYGEITRTKSDMAVCNFTKVSKTRSSKPFLKLPKDKTLDFKDGDGLIRGVIGDGISFGGSMWNKLIKTDILKKAGNVFEERNKIYAEDAFFFFKTLKYIKKICLLDEPLYRYCHREDSVSHLYKENLAQRCENFIRGIEAYYGDMDLHEEIAARSFIFLAEITDNELRRGYRAFKAAVQNEFFREKTRGMNRAAFRMRQKIFYVLYRKKLCLLIFLFKKTAGR